MCSNYQTVTSTDRLLTYFGVERPKGTEPPELVFPGYLAPFIVAAKHRPEMEREAQLGLFGLLPSWAKDLAFGRKTFNARSETVAEKPSFRDAWAKGRRCIIPAEAVYEPCWETGKAVKWAISRRDGLPLGLAGLWGYWRDKDGKEVLSFTMLTINGAGHEIYERMHKPGDEKRMVVILDEADYDAWLNCPVAEAAAFLKQYPARKLDAKPLG
ncbi:MAG: SOS response-associated peptidase [Burkholderiaceae bacterium]|nr:SOS response-associated peptidase [Burkholderiaceae bacterium]